MAILPVTLVIILALLMLGLDLADIGMTVRIPYQTFFSILIFTLGATIIATGGYSFRKANTTVNPKQPERTTQLVTTGVYGVSRNPMYIGFFLWLSACALFIGNLLNLLLLPVFVVLANKLYIVPEEKALETLFKKEFIEYKKRVGRWI